MEDAERLTARQATAKRYGIVALRYGIAVNIVAVLLACLVLTSLPAPGHRIKIGFDLVPVLGLAVAFIALVLPRSLVAIWRGNRVLGLIGAFLTLTPLPLYYGLTVLLCHLCGVVIATD